MHLILCIDERDGISFCGRRLSSDKALTHYIQKLCMGKRLWMDAYSAALFPREQICVDPDFQRKAGAGDYCFLETAEFLPEYPNLESVVLCCWNRRYPATVRFPRSLLKHMRLQETVDFPGNSHDEITVERYTV